jgi:anti-anti-sigma factor
MGRQSEVLRAPAAPESSLNVIKGPCWGRRCVLYLEGSLETPVSAALLDNITATLHRGADVIVLDAAGLQGIDAAGIGELVRAYKTAAAGRSKLRIVHASGWINEILERAALSEVLTDD